MEIFPERQLLLYLSAFSAGVALGAFYEVLRALRILFGVLPVPERMRGLYLRPLPLLGRAIGIREGRGTKVRRTAVIAVLDALFLPLAAITVELILYGGNYGEFRASVPVLCLLGFGLWRVSLARLFARVAPYVAFALSAGRRYLTALLLLPFRGLLRLLMLLTKPLRKLWSTRIRPWLSRRWRALCTRIKKITLRGVSHFKKDGKDHAQNKEKNKRSAAHGDSCVDHTHLPYRAGHHCQTPDGVQPQAAGGRGAGERKGKNRRGSARERHAD